MYGKPDKCGQKSIQFNSVTIQFSEILILTLKNSYFTEVSEKIEHMKIYATQTVYCSSKHKIFFWSSLWTFSFLLHYTKRVSSGSGSAGFHKVLLLNSFFKMSMNLMAQPLKCSVHSSWIPSLSPRYVLIYTVLQRCIVIFHCMNRRTLNTVFFPYFRSFGLNSP